VRAVGANLANQILLIGYGVGDGSLASGEAMLAVQPGGVIPLSLLWQSLASTERDFTVFVHLLDEEGHIWGQADGQPDHGFYPTSFWDPGEVILDGYDTLVDASVPAGQYRLVAGMYLFSTGERLPILAEDGQVLGDEVFLTIVEVEER
jgi:hypothetical protein